MSNQGYGQWELEFLEAEDWRREELDKEREDLVSLLGEAGAQLPYTIADKILNSKWIEDRDRELRKYAWHEGWYDATNGKWGLPEPGANPYGDVDD